MRVGLVAALGAAVMLGGCASVTRGTDENVVFLSEPAGAEMHSVVLNVCREEGSCVQPDPRMVGPDRADKLGPACVTPCTAFVKRSEELLATFTKPGYEPQTVKVATTVGQGAGAVAGNAIVGGVTGLVVDGVTGAAYDHTPNPVKVVLVPVARTAPASPAPAARKHR